MAPHPRFQGATSSALSGEAPGPRLCRRTSELRPNVHIRPKAYLQVLLRLRRLHVWLSHHPNPTRQEASPLLIFIAVVLAVLLAILEVDQHSAALRTLGLLGDPTGTLPNFTNSIGP